MRHFMQYKGNDHIPSTDSEVTPEPDLVTCPECKRYCREKGITKRIDNTEPIDMDTKLIVSPFANYLGD